MAILKETVVQREEIGSRAVRALRLTGFIPANLYSGGQPSKPIKLDGKKWVKILDQNPHLILLDMGEGENLMATIKEIQRDTLSQEIIHVDFQGVQMDQAIHFNVKIHFEGTPIGLKDGGVESIAAESVDVECLPSKVPDFLTIDVSGLKIGDSIPAGTLVLPEGVTLVSDKHMTLVSVLAVRVVVEEVAAVVPVEGEEGEKKEEGEEKDEK